LPPVAANHVPLTPVSFLEHAALTWPGKIAVHHGRLAYTYEVVDFAPGERLVMRTAQGPFPMETTYEWHAVDGARTLMRLRNRGEPSGFGRIAAPALAAAVRRNTTKDLARLKELLER